DIGTIQISGLKTPTGMPLEQKAQPTVSPSDSERRMDGSGTVSESVPGTVALPLKKDNQTTTIEVPEGSTTRVDAQGTVIPAPKSAPPATEAERAIARLVLVFFQDRSRRAIPAVLINAGSRTLVLTAGPAVVVPDGTPTAIDRSFLEFPGRPT